MNQFTKPLRRFIIAALLFALTSLQSLADYINLPIKWSQPIGPSAVQPGRIYGTDRLSDHTFDTIRADDFLCTDPDPIVAVRWWGSYLPETIFSGLQPRPTTPGYTVPFDISFHLSTFPNEPHPFSRPGPLLSLQGVLAQEEFVGIDDTGHYVYRYDAYLPQPFYQQGTHANPIEYFLDIDKPSHEMWGWHETPYGGLDFPAVGTTHIGPWANDPPHDLAFELMTVPEPSSAAFIGLAGGLVLLTTRRRAQLRR